MSDDKRRAWLVERLQPYVWWCGDEVCDCTEPRIDLVKPNLRQGYPWIIRETVWEGKFLTDTCTVSFEEREAWQYAPLREECARRGIDPPSDLPRPPDSSP